MTKTQGWIIITILVVAIVGGFLYIEQSKEKALETSTNKAIACLNICADKYMEDIGDPVVCKQYQLCRTTCYAENGIEPLVENACLKGD